MHITKLETISIPPLGEVEFDFDERVNLFIGPNASGKSTILRLMDACLIAGPHLMKIGLVDSNDEAETMLSLLSVSDDWPRYKGQDASGENVTWRVNLDAMPVSYIPATRVNLKGRFIFDGVHFLLYPEDHVETPVTVESENPLIELFDISTGMFNGECVESAIDWLRNGMTLTRTQENQLRRVLDFGYSCVRGICSEILYDDRPHPFIEEDRGSAPSILSTGPAPSSPPRLVEDDGDSIKDRAITGKPPQARTRRVIHYGMGIGTSDDPLGEPLYAGNLSSGTQGTLLWIYALALKMAHHYDWTEGWEKKPAILLIDEIENHLHPTWQRRVIPALLEHFPGLQIFATTHSPFVVAGLKAGQVHLLRRNEDGVVTATTNTEDIVGWTADEILRTMMGVEDPTDATTAEAARELRQLRNEGPKNDPKDEEQRQKRMQELRQLVDRDLLAGGPMAAQRELFEEQFTEALKKYQQSQDLNQENR